MKLQTATIDLTRPEITKILKAGESFSFKNIGFGFCPIALTITPIEAAPANLAVEVSGSGFTELSSLAGYRFVTEAVDADDVLHMTENCFGDDVIVTNTTPVSVVVEVAAPLGLITKAWIGAVNLDTNIINYSATIMLAGDADGIPQDTTNALWGTLNFFGAPLAQNTSVQQPLWAFEAVDSATKPYALTPGLPFVWTFPAASVAVKVSDVTALTTRTFTLAVLQQGSGY